MFPCAANNLRKSGYIHVAFADGNFVFQAPIVFADFLASTCRQDDDRRYVRGRFEPFQPRGALFAGKGDARVDEDDVVFVQAVVRVGITLQRSMHLQPRQGTEAPWVNSQNFRKERALFAKPMESDGVLHFSAIANS